MRTLIAALLLAGCGPMPLEVDGGPLPDAGACVGAVREALSGTRLKVRYVEGDDGSRAPAGFFDTVRNEACTFSQSEDGRLRCLPTEDLVTVAPSLFVDSTCTQRVAFGGCVFPRFARELTPTCPARTKLFTVMPAAPATLYTNSVGQPCTATPRDPNLTYWVVGGAVAPEQWLTGAFKVEP